MMVQNYLCLVAQVYLLDFFGGDVVPTIATKPSELYFFQPESCKNFQLVPVLLSTVVVFKGVIAPVRLIPITFLPF